MATTRTTTLLPALLAIAFAAVLAGPALALMNSQKLGRNVCLTTGGGRAVAIPGFPGERIDSRLRDDIAFLQRRYKIFVTDGLSEDPVHAANGEHPMGLAIDVVPDVAAGGTWRDISALARWAEPAQDHPAAPFRWVGYDGDDGHGRGHHLHLSWDHSETKPAGRAASVYTLRCPGSESAAGAEKPDAGGSGTSSGGIDPGSGGSPDNSGGIGLGRAATALRSVSQPPVVETGGVGAG